MYTVLIAEDEPMMSKGLRTILEKSKLPILQILEVDNGEEALEVLSSRWVDMVLTDIRMPKMDGLELCKTIKETYPHMMSVIISGYDDFSYAQQALKYGVKDYILKPYSKGAIIDAVDKIIETMTQTRTQCYISDKVFEDMLALFTEGIWIRDDKKIQEGIESIFIHIKELPCSIKNKILKQLSEEMLQKLSQKKGQEITLSVELCNDFEKEAFHLWFQRFLERIYKEIVYSKLNDDLSFIQTAKKYIEENYANDISLEEISGMIGFHPSYFSQVFKSYTSKTFVQYKSEVRIKKAIELLCVPEKSVMDVTIEVGYNDATHFIRTFKKHTGMTPTEFRQRRGMM